MVIHESHQMILSPINTQACSECWACVCHCQDDLSGPCEAVTTPDIIVTEVPD